VLLFLESSSSDHNIVQKKCNMGLCILAVWGSDRMMLWDFYLILDLYFWQDFFLVITLAVNYCTQIHKLIYLLRWCIIKHYVGLFFIFADIYIYTALRQDIVCKKGFSSSKISSESKLYIIEAFLISSAVNYF